MSCRNFAATPCDKISAVALHQSPQDAETGCKSSPASLEAGARFPNRSPKSSKRQPQQSSWFTVKAPRPTLRAHAPPQLKSAIHRKV
ncbi:hypothetical protein Shyhy01_47230 [Streptomyces hygroscopicus subsp. hygroscopicus]|nr:hypothetical protein Shyhy01_47230 [Streptomyces hygroscopicus subsp. hygroscopicus]